MLVRYNGYVFVNNTFVEQIVEVKGFWYEDSIECCIIYASEGMNNIALPMSNKKYKELLDLVEQKQLIGCNFINLTSYDSFEFSNASRPDVERVNEFKEIIDARHNAEFDAKSLALTRSVEVHKQSAQIKRDGYIEKEMG